MATWKSTIALTLIGILALTGRGHAQGRWKAGTGTDCYWDPNDGGPDQCVPSQAPAAPAPEDEPWTEIETDLQRLGETAEELTALGFTNPYMVTETNIPTLISVFERHALWDGLSSDEARELLEDGIYARRNGILVGYAVPRMEAIQLIPNPKLKFPPGQSYTPKHPNPPRLEDCWVMKEKSRKLTELSRMLSMAAIMITTGGGILKGTVPVETPIKKLPMLGRFLEPMVFAGVATGMAAMITGWMGSEYSIAPCMAKGDSQWKTPSGIRAARALISVLPITH